MRKFEFGSSNLEVGISTHSKFEIRNSVFSKCVKAVLSMGKVSVFSNSLRTAVMVVNKHLCLTGRFITISYSAFTSVFALIISTTFSQLNSLFMPIIHSTNKNNEILYKLITIN